MWEEECSKCRLNVTDNIPNKLKTYGVLGTHLVLRVHRSEKVTSCLFEYHRNSNSLSQGRRNTYGVQTTIENPKIHILSMSTMEVILIGDEPMHKLFSQFKHIAEFYQKMLSLRYDMWCCQRCCVVKLTLVRFGGI